MKGKNVFIAVIIAALVALVLIGGCTQQLPTQQQPSRIIQNEKVSIICQADEDCQLIDAKLGFGCCWAGACEAVDLSEESYIAVNAESFAELRGKNCPQECGPAPGCPSSIVNDNFVAKCVNNICVKTSRPDILSEPEPEPEPEVTTQPAQQSEPEAPVKVKVKEEDDLYNGNLDEALEELNQLE